MSYESEHDWEETGLLDLAESRGGRRLRIWILIALICSGVIHLGILVLLGKIEVSTDFAPIRDLLTRTKAFKLERVTLNEPLPKPEVSSPDASDRQEIVDADIAPLVQEMDDFDAQKNLPEHEVRLTPEVTEMSKFLASEKPQAQGATADLSATLATVESVSMAEIQQELSVIKSRILEKTPASDNQLLLQHSLEDDSLVDNENLLERFNTALAKTAGNSDITAGFSDLDDLLNRTGPLLDGTKPILMPTDLLFRYDEANLQETARLSLMKLGLLIQKNPDAQFIIEGHTDTLGTEEYNLELSRKRAQSVRDWLAASLGLNTDQLAVRALGESRPLVHPEGDAEQQSINRRVEIIIRPAKVGNP